MGDPDSPGKGEDPKKGGSNKKGGSYPSLHYGASLGTQTFTNKKAKSVNLLFVIIINKFKTTKQFDYKVEGIYALNPTNAMIDCACLQ